jgi:hypothetical protein
MTQLQGEVLPYTQSGPGGGTITNVGGWTAPKNVLQTVSDLNNNGVKALNVQVIFPSTTAASGSNTFQFDTNVDTLNVSASGTIAALGILLPVAGVDVGIVQGSVIRVLFNVAVTALNLVPQGGANILAAPTSATANSVIRFCLVNSTWTPC